MSVRQKEEIKSLILICRARGWNPRQTTEYVNEQITKEGAGKRLSQSWIQRMIEDTRHEAAAWLKNLTYGKYEYLDMFKTIVERLQTAQNELWDLVDARQGDPKKDFVLIKAYTEIHSINKTLWGLYKDIPLLKPGSVDVAKSLEGIVLEDTTGVYPKISA